MANNIVNYWTWSDSAIVAELAANGVVLEEYVRKEAIDKLKEVLKTQSESGKLKIEEDTDDGTSQEISLEQLRKEDPELMLSRVVFHNKSEDDLPYVFVGHNGRAFYIPKEIEVDVPDYILNSCIKDAIEDRMVPQILQNGDIKWITKKVQRFPYTIIKSSFPAPKKEK